MDRAIQGVVGLRRVGRWRFPVEELTGDAGTIARLGRDGSIRVMFGRGRKVILADGTEWRITSVASGPLIAPLIMSSTGKIASSGVLPARRSYGINLKEISYTLIPLDRIGLRQPRQWALRRHEADIAIVDTVARTVTANEPIPVAAVLLAFTLLTHGVPGEASLMPPRD
jgi:hypothetical protein